MSRSGNPLLLETISIRDGVTERLELHQARVDRSRKALHNATDGLMLIDRVHPPSLQGQYKCRIVYGREIESMEYRLYTPRIHRGIAVATIDEIEYSFKFTDRQIFAELEARAGARAVIVVKEGQVTDSTYANLAFFDGEQWITPSRYLLNGVMRQWSLAQELIEEKPITLQDLRGFTHVRLINAMLPLDLSPSIPLEDIVML
jgi:4-amino-4-deoxychorismate lyase